MAPSQQRKSLVGRLPRIGIKRRLLAGLVFAGAIVLFAFVHWAAENDRIDIGRIIGPCGFKQRYGLSCPTCGMTTAMTAFAKGQILRSFYIQPAAAVMCSAAAATAVFCLLVAALGTDFGLGKYCLRQLRLRYVVLIIIIVLGGAWVVTIARALAQSRP